MKNLLTFEDFVNEAKNKNLNEFPEVESWLMGVLSELGLKFVSAELTKHVVNAINTRIMDDQNTIYLSINENVPGRESTVLPYYCATGVVTDVKGWLTNKNTKKNYKGEKVYFIAQAGRRMEGGNDWTLGELGLYAEFASGRVKELNPVKDHLWNHTYLNKNKETYNFIIKVK